MKWDIKYTSRAELRKKSQEFNDLFVKKLGIGSHHEKELNNLLESHNKWSFDFMRFRHIKGFSIRLFGWNISYMQVRAAKQLLDELVKQGGHVPKSMLSKDDAFTDHPFDINDPTKNLW